MKFDFDEFQKVASLVYSGGEYSFDECMEVFRYFFEQYEKFTGEAHPPIRADQIKTICERMPPDESSAVEYGPECYPEIIDRYFQTPFRNCDYRINHFFSGRIRELRWLEYMNRD